MWPFLEGKQQQKHEQVLAIDFHFKAGRLSECLYCLILWQTSISVFNTHLSWLKETGKVLTSSSCQAGRNSTMKHCGVKYTLVCYLNEDFSQWNKRSAELCEEETANEVITLVLPEELMHTERAKNTVSTNMHSVNNKDVCNTYGINRLWNLITMNYKNKPNVHNSSKWGQFF